MSHAANPDLINRLKRAQGHLAKIVEMVAEGRDRLKRLPTIEHRTSQILAILSDL